MPLQARAIHESEDIPLTRAKLSHFLAERLLSNIAGQRLDSLTGQLLKQVRINVDSEDVVATCCKKFSCSPADPRGGSDNYDTGVHNGTRRSSTVAIMTLAFGTQPLI